eukprot:4572692-Pyramimonas_sp.AAC.1
MRISWVQLVLIVWWRWNPHELSTVRHAHIDPPCKTERCVARVPGPVANSRRAIGDAREVFCCGAEQKNGGRNDQSEWP